MSDSVEKSGSTIAACSQHFTPAVRSAVWAVLAGSLAYYSMFRLPFRFPPQQRLWSASYAFGYNNSVAILSMAILLGGVALFHFWRSRGASDLKVDFPHGAAAAKDKLLGWALATVSILY